MTTPHCDSPILASQIAILVCYDDAFRLIDTPLIEVRASLFTQARMAWRVQLTPFTLTHNLVC